MQNGSITRSKRLKGPDVWEFRWRESGPDGKRKQRRMVVGSIRQFADESAALRTITALRRDINLGNARLRAKPITVSELVDHYRQRELEPDTPGLSQQVDPAALGSLSSLPHSGGGSRTMVTFSTLGPSDLR